MGEATTPGLAPPGPPSAAGSGPMYGARYGDPAYEARYGGSTAAPGSAAAMSPVTGASARGGAAPLPRFRPGVMTLRPQGVGDLLDAAVRTLRERPALFLGVGAVAVVVATIVRACVDALVGVTVVSPEGTAGLRITPSIALTPVLAALLAGVLAVPTSQAVLGESPTLRGLWRALRPRAGALSAYVGLAAAACALPTMVIWFGLGGRQAQQFDLFLGMGAVALAAEAARLPFVAAPAAIVLEGASPWRALRRSLRLIRGEFLRTLAVALIGRLLVALVTAALMAPLGAAVAVASATTGFALRDSLLGPALSTLFLLATTVLTMPYEAVLRSLFYVDLRVRSEGLDVVLVEAARRGVTP